MICLSHLGDSLLQTIVTLKPRIFALRAGRLCGKPNPVPNPEPGLLDQYGKVISSKTVIWSFLQALGKPGSIWVSFTSLLDALAWLQTRHQFPSLFGRFFFFSFFGRAHDTMIRSPWQSSTQLLAITGAQPRQSEGEGCTGLRGTMSIAIDQTAQHHTISDCSDSELEVWFVVTRDRVSQGPCNVRGGLRRSLTLKRQTECPIATQMKVQRDSPQLVHRSGIRRGEAVKFRWLRGHQKKSVPLCRGHVGLGMIWKYFLLFPRHGCCSQGFGSFWLGDTLFRMWEQIARVFVAITSKHPSHPLPQPPQVPVFFFFEN